MHCLLTLMRVLILRQVSCVTQRRPPFPQISKRMSTSMRMGPAFQFNVGCPIVEGIACVGRFDGKHPSLACATAGNRVVIHDAKPLENPDGTAAEPVRFLNFSRETTSLCAGTLSSASDSAALGDVLVVGTATTLSAYDVHRNRDCFFRELPDGAFATVVGCLGDPASAERLVFVGGSCSVIALDGDGQDRLWTGSRDTVRTLALMRWTAASPTHVLISGSDDCEIRTFNGVEVTNVITEADRILRIVPSGVPGQFAFSLANGTVGVYEQTERKWRHQSKALATSLSFCDVDFDGVPELVIGYSDGRVEVRTCHPQRGIGELLFKDSLGSGISAIVAADYRQDGRQLPMMCSSDGEVRGFVALETTMDEVVENREQLLLQALIREKQQLLFDVRSLENQIMHQRLATQAAAATQQAESAAAVHPPNSVMLPPNTTVRVRLRPSSETKTIDLMVTASEGAVVRAAVVTGELIFPKGDSGFYYAEAPTATLCCSISLDRDIATDLSLVVLVGSELSEVFQVHDVKFRLPKFSMYVPVSDLPRKPTGHVTVRISERGGRYHAWLASCFNTSSQPDQDFVAQFVSLRDGTCIHLSATSANGGELTIRSDNMDVCGEIIQDLGQFLGLTELQSEADFPTELAQFRDVLQRVEAFNSVRAKLTADMADSTQLVKALVIKAEDARILSDTRLMKKAYGTLYETNRELMGEYLKRENNHNQLLSALKEVNTMIQKAGKLRIGEARNRLVAECRAAVKANNIHALFEIIRTGKPA